MISEQWTQWEPIKSLSRKYYVESILYNDDKLKIELIDAINDDGGSVLVNFENSIHTYRDTNESYRLKIIDSLCEKYDNNFHRWTFFKVKNSEYLQWLSEEAHGNIESKNLTLFVFIAAESIVEVVAEADPKVVFTKEPENQEEVTRDQEYFDNTEDPDVENISTGKVGKLPDGKIVIARNNSADGRPTLETYDPKTKHRNKIRYNK